MNKFKMPQKIDPAKLDAFVEGAASTTAPPPTVAAAGKPTPPSSPAVAYPWKEFAPDALPKTGINLRLNDYEHQALKWLAERDDRSLQYTLKRLLKQALEAELPR